MKKKPTRYVPMRNFEALKRRVTRSEQAIILLQGDRNKLIRQVKDLQWRLSRVDLEIADLDSSIAEILQGG